MKLVSWNVNGLRACVGKGFLDYFYEVDADFVCLQETKLQEGQINLELNGYHQFWNYAEKKGYSGTAIFTKHKPLAVSYGVGDKQVEPEGRIITLEYADYYVVTVYTPNAKRDLSRLDYRLQWEEELRAYLKSLNQVKPVIFCGDLNVAFSELDLKNAKSNKGNSGFTLEERAEMAKLLDSGFVDTFRFLYPDRTDAYTWWSYMNGVRARNIGWRIDYFIISQSIAQKLVDSQIHSDILGSDHCPVCIEVDL
ncbi:MAG: exodeoxyribonuclease III [Bacillus sp. (in: firmicutes)]